MKSSIIVLVLTCCMIRVTAQSKSDSTNKRDTSKAASIVDAACGQCQFGLAGKSCDLAVRINGNAYFVDGTNIDDHGDAHAKDGFCNLIRKAKVAGEVRNGRFQATYFKLISESNKDIAP